MSINSIFVPPAFENPVDPPTTNYLHLVQKPLPYGLGDLAPVMSQHQLDLHYNKHAKAYVTNYNVFLDQADAARAAGDFETYIQLYNQMKFNGDAHLNHEFFWTCLAPQSNGGGVIPMDGSTLRSMIEREWGSIQNFQQIFAKQSLSLQGSGWAWLVYNKSTQQLEYRQTFNHGVV